MGYPQVILFLRRKYDAAVNNRCRGNGSLIAYCGSVGRPP